MICACPERDPFIGCPRPEHQTEKRGIAPAAGEWEYGLRRADGYVDTVVGGTVVRDEADARSVIAAEQVRTDGLPPVSLTVVRRWVSEWEEV